MLKKGTDGRTFVIVLSAVLVGLAVHQAVIAPRIAKKKTA
jgi:hypothetical protein